MLGTAWWLAGGEGTITLDLAGGAVPVSFAEGVGWMTPPPVELGGTLEPERIARLVGLVPGQLSADYPARTGHLHCRLQSMHIERAVD